MGILSPAGSATPRSSNTRISKTTARNGQPSSVKMDVISAVQERLGAWAVKSCPSRFGATGRLCLDWVVALYFRATLARSPSARIRLATRWRLTVQPSARKSKVRRGAP